jgi:surface antigen
MRRTLKLVLLLAVVAGAGLLAGDKLPRTWGPAPEPGAAIDSLNGVVVYHNGGMSTVHGRNTVDGYNVGLRYQCVEFVKRYYLEHYGHRMPDSYGHAKDFFDPAVKDGGMNPARGLLQYTNPSPTPPRTGDLVVFDAWTGNAFGHVAIISEVKDGEVEVIQQNTGSTRDRYDLDLIDGHWRIDNRRILGWLRMP